MTPGRPEEPLAALGAAVEVDVVPLGEDGRPLPATTIWVVRVGDGLYARSYRGARGGWYRAALRTGRGRVEAGDSVYDVVFDAAPGAGRELVDAAYLAKYAHSPYVAAMVTDEAAATTLRLVVAAGPR